MSDSLSALSPLDGRYNKSLKGLSVYFSEEALIKYRLKIEVEYLISLSHEQTIKELPPFLKQDQNRLRALYLDFDNLDAKRVKQIEKTTNHDVKAVEYFLQEKVDKQFHHWIHFSLTSEDVNNLAYSMMWRDGLKKVYLPCLIKINDRLFELSKKYKRDSLLSLTHGQPATPTTFGKELLVFHSRLQRQIDQIKNHHLLGKFGGATGTWSAHLAAYPNTDWIAFAKKFISSLGLVPNLVTTQIEPHDSISESFHHIVRINSILIDLCKDIWFYISRGVLGQKRVKGEVGSSTMPHKINPIQFENAEGNLGISNCLLNHFTAKLPVSRMQRDLSDSTVIRNQGVALGHSYLALNNILKGLLRISLNKQHILNELNSHWEILGEAIQTVLRKANTPNAYEQLKELTRGQTINQASVISFIKKLNISDKDKDNLLKLTPENYVGVAPKLIESL
ncbi:MAG: adenylosuccinate lyase [Candidatus Neomarinimicrobiota bacterium]